MRKFLLIFLILGCLLYSEVDYRAQFLKFYYDGDYQRAHEILRNAFSDAFDLQVWEERLHLQQTITNCNHIQRSTDSVRGLALLHIGRIQDARNQFTDDVPSFLGLTTLALWQNDSSAAHSFIEKALQKAPDFPDVLFMAGNLAETDEQAADYFHKYLDTKPSDESKRLSAEQAIDFMTKTRGIPLNIAGMEGEISRLDSHYDSGKLFIKAQVNETPPIRLLVDTGAAGVSLEKGNWTPKISSDLLMIGLGKIQKSAGHREVLDAFTAGGFQVKNPVVAVNETLHVNDAEGIVGSVFFSKFGILLPMNAQGDFTLLSTNPALWLTKNASLFSTRVTLPFYLVNKMMVVKGSIKKSEPELDMLIDSGASRSVLSLAAARKYAHLNYSLSRRASRKPELFGLGGRIENLKIAENVEIKLNVLYKEFDRMLALNLAEISEAMDLEIDAILGQDFLSGYTLLIDYRSRTITFLK